MRTYHRFTAVLALTGALVLRGTSTARAQDTSQARADTSEYRGYGGADTSAAGDTVEVGEPSATVEDALVCQDGSNAVRTDGCVSNGGIDWAATEAATKARADRTTGGGTGAAAPADTTTMPRDTT